MLSPKSLAKTSIYMNLLLGGLKLGVGISLKSVALIADGIHSSLDVASSFITYLGIKIAKKPADIRHPYGHGKAEPIAGFIVTFFLLISAFWIIFEGVDKLLKHELSPISVWAFPVVVLSIVVNEIMARLKFKVGRQKNNLALIADGQHSRADSISSIAVLIGLGLSNWFFQADGLTAVLIGCYILYETYILGREVSDNLLDISNPEIEKKIKDICRKQEIDLLSIKTRRIGPENSAELKIGLNKEWKMYRVNEVVENLEKVLKEKVENLQFLTIEVASHQFKRGYIKTRSGQIKPFKEVSKVRFKKRGFRTIIPFKDGGLYNDFGAPSYMVVDVDKKGKIIQKKIIKNPYFVVGRGHGVRFVRTIKADRVITPAIGQGGEERLREMKVDVKIVSPNEKIENILRKLYGKE